MTSRAVLTTLALCLVTATAAPAVEARCEMVRSGAWGADYVCNETDTWTVLDDPMSKATYCINECTRRRTRLDNRADCWIKCAEDAKRIYQCEKSCQEAE